MKTRRSDINKKAVFAKSNHKAYAREIMGQAKKDVANKSNSESYKGI